MRQNRRFISFVIRSLFHSSCQQCCHTFYKYKSCELNKQSIKSPLSTNCHIVHSNDLFLNDIRRILFRCCQIPCRYGVQEKKERNIHIYDPLFTACIEKSILSWLNSRLKSPLWYEMRGVNVFKLITTLYKWLRYFLIRFK